MPSAGHVSAGESMIDGAIRETEEELGIKTKKEDFIFVKEYICDRSWEIASIYLLKIDVDLKNFKLQKEEVSEVKWLNYEDFKKLFYSDEFVKHDEEYRKIVLELLK